MGQRWTDDEIEQEYQRNQHGDRIFALVLLVLLVLGMVWAASSGSGGDPGDCVATLSKPC